jgi:hypothetical protein
MLNYSALMDVFVSTTDLIAKSDSKTITKHHSEELKKFIKFFEEYVCRLRGGFYNI